MKERELEDAVETLACSIDKLTDQLRHQNNSETVLHRIAEMDNNMAIQLSQVKAAVAAAAKASKEAFAELGTRIADLNKEIQDLKDGLTDPTVTDEAFEADLRSLATDSQALADIVPGTPTPEPQPPV